MKDLWNLIRQVFSEWGEDKAPRLAAALSYYTVFSIPPLLLTVIGIASLFFDRAEVQKAVLSEVSGLLSPGMGDAIATILNSTNSTGKGGLAAVIGVVTLFIGASGVFGQLQDALNTIWEVKPMPNQGIWNLIQKRLFSFLMVLVLGFLLMVSMVLSTALAAFGGFLQNNLPGAGSALGLIDFLLPFVVITLLMAFIFKYMPDARMAWRDVWLGAAITSLLFNVGKTLIGIYLGRSNPASAFGAAASIVLIFVWVYYTAQILFIGAEFAQVYARKYGSGIIPEKHAQRVTEEDRAEEGISHR